MKFVCEQCGADAAHAERWYESHRAWCETHTPWSGHYEWCNENDCHVLIPRTAPAPTPPFIVAPGDEARCWVQLSSHSAKHNLVWGVHAVTATAVELRREIPAYRHMPAARYTLFVSRDQFVAEWKKVEP